MNLYRHDWLDAATIGTQPDLLNILLVVGVAVGRGVGLAPAVAM